MSLVPATSRSGSGTALTWTTFTAGGIYANGAADFGAPYESSRYAVDTVTGVVWIFLAANPGTDGIVATLPVGARPAADAIDEGFADGSPGPFEVRSNGEIDFYLNPTASAMFSLRGFPL